MEYDFVVIGGGIVGVSTAWQLKQRHPNHSVLLVEKETQLACHQTGHNSGVIHAGVYYPPGSLKADFCQRGAAATKAFCHQHGIKVEQCGKLLVATNAQELTRMEALYQRCIENGLDVELWQQAKLWQAESNITGLAAIYVPSTSIVDYRLVTQTMAQQFVALGGEIALGHRVVAIDEQKEAVSIVVECDEAPNGLSRKSIRAGYLVACAGLMADRIATMMAIECDFQIIPYRGEYYRLSPKHNGIVRHLIYPIPDPDLPFLGVHLTRMIDGSVTVGPNAVQGWQREGYKKVNFSWQDSWQMLRFSGFWRVSATYWRTGLREWYDSWSKRGYLARVRKYCPSLQLSDLEPYPAGIRAQAVMKDGRMVHDFLFAHSARSLHVCNAPSPAATSAIPIGEFICQQVTDAFSTVKT